jgi:hypothetical protein
MADFSKQYCEIHAPEMPFDFDILEEAKHIQPGHYIPMICEGFGFIAISKDENNEILLAVPTEDGEYVHWKEYNDIIK